MLLRVFQNGDVLLSRKAHLRNEEHLMIGPAKPANDVRVDILIGKDSHQTLFP